MPLSQTPSPLDQSTGPRRGRSSRWAANGLLASAGLGVSGIVVAIVAPSPNTGSGFLETSPAEDVGLMMLVAGIGGVLLCVAWMAVAALVSVVAPGLHLNRTGWAACAVVAGLVTTGVVAGVVNRDDGPRYLDAVAMPAPVTTDGEVCAQFSVESEADFGYTMPLCRTSDRTDRAVAAVELLIAGPTVAERAEGYRSPLTGTLRGASTCGGARLQPRHHRPRRAGPVLPDGRERRCRHGRPHPRDAHPHPRQHRGHRAARRPRQGRRLLRRRERHERLPGSLTQAEYDGAAPTGGGRTSRAVN